MQIDARGITCPKPVIMTLQALKELLAGEALEVLVDDETARGNLTRLASEKGCALTVTEAGDHTVMTLVPEGAVEVASAEEEAAAICDLSATVPSVFAFGSSSMGQGDPELGHILVKGLIYALSQQDQVPSCCLFFNDGARLTCEGSDTVEDVRTLEERGCRILTCGTCLDFHHLRDSLAVGGVTNLYEIAQILSAQPGVVTV
ncbi:sulfurtransferase-like selenium metabolism protein YedF [Caniella muris]|uniref:sulfurtransferase-like selenium metabolism protein YedF n=1 Tax=Caniella muris TaxID=2941502 RepID=UPI00203BCFD6|nr:sulfurtransferase-like selenium metabolism protein YedF [Caniella muris]